MEIRWPDRGYRIQGSEISSRGHSDIWNKTGLQIGCSDKLEIDGVYTTEFLIMWALQVFLK